MSNMVPMYGFGGGSGGSGGTLNVTAPAGVSVTVSKDGKSKTKVADSSGVAVFKGLATGEWTLTITDGDRVRTQSVVITADYSAVIAFFAATINITYPAGSACTATDEVRTLAAPDTSGVWACVVPNTGTWTVTITDGDKSVSKPIEITADGQSESLSISYFSATINVTYPEGSVCTATDGVTTLTATDTSGTWDCVVPNTGTWTVACTDGTKNTEKTVPITENGQSDSVELSYVFYMVKDGVLKVLFSTIGNLSVTQYDGYVSFKGSASGGHCAYIEIDLTHYSKLVCTGTKQVSSSVSTMYRICTWLTSTTSPAYNNATASTTYESGTNTTTLDVSSLSGVYLVGLTASSTNEQKITDFHLE